MPAISIIILSHNKPRFVREAIQCVLNQTYQDWEATLMDSGVLLNQGFFGFLSDPRFSVIPTGETPGMAKTTNMASWCFNQWLNSSSVRGELVFYLCDDDLLYPEAFATFWDYFIQHGREPQAMYASQHIGLVDEQGKTEIIGKRIADRPAGRFCKGRRLDCRVDYLQFCHTKKILEDYRKVYQTSAYHPLDRGYFDHADGVFMERIGALTKVHPINKFLSMNRRTTASVNLEYSTSPFVRALITLRKKAKGGMKRLLPPRARAGG